MEQQTLRDRNKSLKRASIRSAAQRLFATQGFDRTSTRDIANEAGVGLATLFLYASDKRDLLFLACNEDLEALTATAFACPDPQVSLLDQLCAVFRCFYEHYGRNRLLSRDLLRELTFYTAGQQSERFQMTRRATVAAVEGLVRAARERGLVTAPVDDSLAATLIFYAFAAEVRRWLGEEETSPSDGVGRLRLLLRIVMAGLGPEVW